MKRYLTTRGYAFVRDGDRLLAEHRLVAERKMGRPLRPGEQVHHRNGVRDDNRPENLRVFPSRAAHLRHHRRRQSVALLQRYARFLAVATGLSISDAIDYALLRLDGKAAA